MKFGVRKVHCCWLSISDLCNKMGSCSGNPQSHFKGGQKLGRLNCFSRFMVCLLPPSGLNIPVFAVRKSWTVILSGLLYSSVPVSFKVFGRFLS